jgi:[acyl-carrier-protein] S-malonyltransferase
MSFAVICSGQGAQSPDLFSSFPFGPKGLAIQQRILDAGSLDPEVAGWLAASDPDSIFKNHFSQPLLCLFQLMLWAELDVPVPKLFAGYSLGELVAYGCADAWSPEETVRLAGVRARAMDAAGSGELLAVTGLPVKHTASEAARHGACLAIVLSDEHCVVGCPPGAEEVIAAALMSCGASQAIPLKVSVPSHTRFLDAAVEPFRAALQGAAWHQPSAPVLAGIDAQKVLRQQAAIASLPEQIHRTVRWDLVEQRIIEEECSVVLELGPGCQLAHALLSNRFHGAARSAAEFHSAEGISAWIHSSLARFDS